MEQLRKPFQGVWNIIRFNRHFYLLTSGLSILILLLNNYLAKPYNIYTNIVCLLIICLTLISLLVSFYIYDLSGFYKLTWLNTLIIEENSKIVNINAGFDEISILLKNKYPTAKLNVFDFYNASKHTEISIKRARRAYSSYPNTTQINTSSIPLQDNYVDIIYLILSVHEIRSEAERDIFFSELKRVLKHTGKIIVTEHLRNLPNFLAYNIGFFHFFPKSAWYRTFKHADMNVFKEINITPFIKTFILEKHGAAS